MRRPAVVVSVGVAALAVVAAAVSLVYLGGGRSAGPPAERASATAADRAHPSTPPTGRLVVVSRTMPAPSTGAHLNAQLVSGSVPVAGSEATVLDDLDCAPDAAGISHCRNPLVLADGRRVEVIHPHSMAVVPCLTAGERVRLVWRRDA